MQFYYRFILLFVNFHNTVNYRNVSIFYLEHHNLSRSDGSVRICQKQDIASLKCWFHRATVSLGYHTVGHSDIDLL